MIEKLPESRTPAFGFRVSGQLTPEDIAAIAPAIESFLAETKQPIGLLADLSAMHGATWAARFDEMRFLHRHTDRIARFAVVSNDDWQQLGEMVVATAGGLQAQTLYFQRSELSHAWHYVRMKKPDDGAPIRVITPGRGLFSDYTPEYMGV